MCAFFFIFIFTMPAPGAFARAFAIKKGSIIESENDDVLQITKSKVGHTVLERFRRYEFPIRVTLLAGDAKHATVNRAVRMFRDHVAEPRVVHSQYGNPYRCTIDTTSVHAVSSQQTLAGELVVEVEAVGQGVRIMHET